MIRFVTFVAMSLVASSLPWSMSSALAADAPTGAPDAAPQRQAAPSAPALAGYRPWREAVPASWRRANDEVGRLGGHAGMLQAQASAASARDAQAHPPGVAGKESGR